MKNYLTMYDNMLVITEKHNPREDQRDGGAQLVNTLKTIFNDHIKIIQFSQTSGISDLESFTYPFYSKNRFENRLQNAHFITQTLNSLQLKFSHILFIHVSMQFGISKLNMLKKTKIWTFPMFLTPSYREAGEHIPDEYFYKEKEALKFSNYILTPSPFEKKQLIEIYNIEPSCISMVPRGVTTYSLPPKRRVIEMPNLRLCSIGSIKPQKNTLALVKLFSYIHKEFNQATLKIIGPVQDATYYQTVLNQVKYFNLSPFIEFMGYVPPENLAACVTDCHIHLSAARVETFGRTIFETLACGLPNIVQLKGNASFDFLGHLPYIRFFDQPEEVIGHLKEMINQIANLSTMASEIGQIYDDKTLSLLLRAEIKQEEPLIISDYDGTLFHKKSLLNTKKYMGDFKKFTKRIICSARSINDLLHQIKYYDLSVDWIIGYSGAVITDGKGNLLKIFPLDSADIREVEATYSFFESIIYKGEIIQAVVPMNDTPCLKRLRYENYQEKVFISSWEASKLKASLWILKHIKWKGRVVAWGDSIYDKELLTYFNGRLIK